MILITEQNHSHKCCKKIVDKQYKGIFGYTESRICDKPAVYSNGFHCFCRHHSQTGRYVIRQGECGPIVSRHNTEIEARNTFNSLQMTGIEIQHLSKSHRRTLLNAYK